MPRTLNWLSAFVGCSLVTPLAHAHITLKYPARRPAGDIKIGPCGNAAKGASPVVLEPGATITVTWDETIQHPGHYRIAFDVDGDDFPEPTSYDDVKAPLPFDLGNGASVLVDSIMDKTGPFVGNTPYEQSVTLPDVECETCTLQVIQVMTEKVPYTVNGDDVYHECADIALRRIGMPDAGVLPPPDAGPPPVAGAVAPPPVAGMVAPPPAGMGAIAGMAAGTGVATGGTVAPLPVVPMAGSNGDSGGCAIAGPHASDPASRPVRIAILPIAVVLLALRGRRRTRGR